MASPIGHSLLGLIVARSLRVTALTGTAWGNVYVLLAANAPDLDFLPGLLVGDINRFHQSSTHSFTGALAFGLLTASAARATSTPVRYGVAGAALYASHLVLDFFSQDARSPFGQPLVWPGSESHFIAAWTPFGGVLHGVQGDPLSVFFTSLFSWHNLGVLALEIAIFLPLLIVVRYLSTRDSRRSI